ncbi:MAG: hypothetical protein Q4Q27_15230 [Methanosarcina mazei]|nr:hypothetical protein [Methanosarcina mazei]
MNVVYFAHSYRKEDNFLVKFFGELIQSQGLVLTIDPPSQKVNAARLERHLNCTDGMVAVLSWREDGVSDHIYFEISLCLRARKPLLVFIEDNIDTKKFPSRILQRRFSRGYLPREIKEHKHAIQSLKSYMGATPLPKYQPSQKKRACLLIGLSILHKSARETVIGIIKKRNYSVLQINETTDHIFQKQNVNEIISLANLAICFVDSKSYVSNYLLGAIRIAMVPTILLTTNSSYSYDLNIPKEYQPRLIKTEDLFLLKKIINTEINLYEDNIVDIEDKETLESYIKLLFKFSSASGKYDSGTYNIFARELNMRDNYVISGGQTSSVGPNASVHDISFSQIWNETKDYVDLNRLAEELEILRLKLKEEAKTPDNDISIGNVAGAESYARNGDGLKAYEYLQNAGKWALDIACKISIPVATRLLEKLVGL